jgi:hypothetical protein
VKSWRSAAGPDARRDEGAPCAVEAGWGGRSLGRILDVFSLLAPRAACNSAISLGLQTVRCSSSPTVATVATGCSQRLHATSFGHPSRPAPLKSSRARLLLRESLATTLVQIGWRSYEKRSFVPNFKSSGYILPPRHHPVARLRFAWLSWSFHERVRRRWRPIDYRARQPGRFYRWRWRR